MALKLNVNRTFAQTVQVVIENAGEILEGDITVKFIMPKISEYDADLEASREIAVLIAKLRALPADSPDEQVDELTQQINALVSERKNLLKRVLHSIEGLEYFDDNGVPLTATAIIETATDDVEIAKTLLEAYHAGLEQKMAPPKKVTSDDSPATNSPEVTEA